MFLAPGAGSAILEMPDCDKLELSILNCTAMELNLGERKNWMKQSRQDKSCANKNSKLNVCTISKSKYETVYFIADPGKETDMTGGAKITVTVHKIYNDLFAGIGCLKGTFPCT